MPYAVEVSEAGIWFGREGGLERGEVASEGLVREVPVDIGPEDVAFAPTDRPSAMFTVAHSPRMPSASHRKALAELAESELGPRLQRHAIVSNSAIAQGVVTALSWLSRKPYEEKIFRTPTDAIAWLQERHPHVGEGLWSRISARVPASSRFEGGR